MRNIFQFSFILFSVWALISCAPKKTDALIVHIPQEPEDIHPTNGSSALRAELNLYTQLSLLKINYQSGELIPCVAKQLPTISSNGLFYNYQLDSNLTWDNKQSISSTDVCFTAKANCCLLTNNAATKSNWDNLKNITIKNNWQLEVEMKTTSSYNTWMWVECPILQQNFYDKEKTLSKYSIEQLRDSVFIATHTDIKQWADNFNDTKYYNNPTYMDGAGVYKLTQWNKGENIVLEKKKNHWSQNMGYTWWNKAGSDKIIFKINSNNASAMLELKNGTMDVSTYLDYASFSELANDKTFTQTHTTELADTYNYTYIALNTKPDLKKHQPLFTELPVRKAIAMLIPYNQINKLLFAGKCKRAVGPVSVLKKDFNTALKPIEENIENAKQLLFQAGWADTDADQILDKKVNNKKVNFEFSINYMSGQKQWEDMAKIIAESFRKVGITVMLNPLDYNGFLGSAMNHDFDMTLGAWQTTTQPDDFAQLWHSNAWHSNGFNFTGFGNKHSDALIDSINHSVNDDNRIALSKQFQQMVYDEQPYVFLFSQLRRVVVNKKWAGATIYNEYPGVLLNTLYLKDEQ